MTRRFSQRSEQIRNFTGGVQIIRRPLQICTVHFNDIKRETSGGAVQIFANRTTYPLRFLAVRKVTFK